MTSAPDNSLKNRGKYFIHAHTGSPILTNIKDWQLINNSIVDNLTPDIGVAVSYKPKSATESSPIITIFVVYRKAKLDPKTVVEVRMKGSIPHMKLNRAEPLILPDGTTVDSDVYNYLGYISVPFVGTYLPVQPEEGNEIEGYLIQDPRLTNRIYWIQVAKEFQSRDMKSILKFLRQYISSTKKN